MPTSMVLPSGKTRQLMSGVYTTQGREDKIVSLEQQSIILTVHVLSMAAGARVNVDVYEIGDNVADLTLIHSFPGLKTADDTPVRVRLSPGGSIYIRVDHSDAVT